MQYFGWKLLYANSHIWLFIHTSSSCIGNLKTRHSMLELTNLWWRGSWWERWQCPCPGPAGTGVHCQCLPQPSPPSLPHWSTQPGHCSPPAVRNHSLGAAAQSGACWAENVDDDGNLYSMNMFLLQQHTHSVQKNTRKQPNCYWCTVWANLIFGEQVGLQAFLEGFL